MSRQSSPASANRARAAVDAERARLEKELVATERKLTGLIDALADGFRAPGLQRQLDELENRKAELTARLAEPHRPQPRLHPNLAELYRAKVADLRAALTGEGADRAEAFELLRGLIERVTLRPAETESGYELELTGDIARMVELGSGNKKAAPVGAAVQEAFSSSVKVVAGARFELTTFRL